jgi:hypothetical protein
MTDAEINDIVSKLLRDRYGRFGFVGSAVVSQEDFDGTPIIRVTARFDRRRAEVPRDWLGIVHEIRSSLLERGEQRYVFLDGDYLREEALVEEDEG